MHRIDQDKDMKIMDQISKDIILMSDEGEKNSLQNLQKYNMIGI